MPDAKNTVLFLKLNERENGQEEISEATMKAHKCSSPLQNQRTVVHEDIFAWQTLNHKDPSRRMANAEVDKRAVVGAKMKASRQRHGPAKERTSQDGPYDLEKAARAYALP